MFRGVLFDVDGTLLDSSDFFYRACEYTFQAHGLPARTREEVLAVIRLGQPLETCYHHLSPGVSSAQLCETHRSFQMLNVQLCVPFGNTRETVRLLWQEGIALAAVTTRSRRTSLKTLELAGIAEYLSAIISGEDTRQHKPHPAPLWQALERLNLPAEQTVMVGDTEADILAGRRAGTRTIAVSYGLSGTSIAESQPDWIVDDIQQILPLVLAGQFHSS